MYNEDIILINIRLIAGIGWNTFCEVSGFVWCLHLPFSERCGSLVVHAYLHLYKKYTYVHTINCSFSVWTLSSALIVFMIPKRNTSKFFYYECFYGVTLHQEHMMMLLVVMHSWLHTMLCLNTTAIDSACVCVYKATMMIIYHISFDFIAQSYYGNNDYIIRISLHVQTHHMWLVLPDMILVWLVALIRILAGRDL